MVDWSAHKFVLIWLKGNLDNYQYRTAEANQIKNEMKSNALESPQDIGRFAELYEQFVQMVERNPLTANDKEDQKATIVANDFYYYFYPTKQNLLLPLGLQIETGAANTPENAAELQKRLEKTFETWKAQYDAERAKRTKKSDFLKNGSDYAKVLEKMPSSKGFVFFQTSLLILVVFCLGACVLIWQRVGLYPKESLKAVAYGSVVAASLAFLLKSLVWLVRERKRRNYLNAWKQLQNAGKELKSEANNANFRTPEGMKTIFERIGTRNYGKGSGQLVQVDAMKENMPENVLGNLSEPKKQRILYTIRPVHLVTMLMVTICCLFCLVDVFPESLGKWKDRLTDVIVSQPVFWSLGMKEQDSEILTEINPQIVVVQSADAYQYDGKRIASDDIMATYAQGTSLDMVDCYREVLDDAVNVWFREKDAQMNVLYVSAEDVRLRNKDAILPTTVKVLDRNGKPKQIANVGNLIDGSALTSVELEKGDIVQAVFQDPEDIKAVYMMNGNVAGTPEEDSGVYLANLSLNDGEQERFVFEKECDQSGYVMAMPGGAVSTLQIQVVEMSSKKDTCWLTELVFCR